MLWASFLPRLTTKADAAHPLHALADRLAPTAQAQFLAVIDSLKNQTTLTALEAAAETGSAEAVLSAIPWGTLPEELSGLLSTLREAFNASGTMAAASLSQQVGFEISWNLASPTAVAAANAQAAALVTNISQASQDAIRQLVTRAVAEGVPGTVLAKEIQGSIGLTAPQEAAAANLQARLVAEGVDAGAIDTQVARYRQTALELRAETISSHELLTALNQGHLSSWQQSIEDGNLTASDWVKTWLIIPDDRVCLNICAPTPGFPENQAVPIDGLFLLGDGNMVQMPPGHIRCRCLGTLTYRGK